PHARVPARQAGGVQDSREGAAGLDAAFDALQEDPPRRRSSRGGASAALQRSLRVNASARRLLKSAVDAICLVMAAPAAVMCAAETRLGPRAETMFTAWAQTFALVPGIAGVFLRRAFYRLTLEACASSFCIGFGAMFTHRAATIEQDVYVGPYALIGSCRLGRGALVGSRSSILSGGSLHTLDASGRWAATDLTRLHRVDIGAYAWIGEASV